MVNLTVGREIAELPLPGLPHLGSGITWMRDGRRVMATPHLKEPRLSVIDTDSWEVVATVDTLGPGFFLRSHEATPYVWADVFLGPKNDTIQLIDKQSLEIVAKPDAAARRHRRPRRVRPSGPSCAGQHLGGRRRARRLRRADASRR